jgi:hypothetical protein
MINQILKLFLFLGGAVATHFVADKVTEKYTGKHIHEHVFEWYRRLHDTLSAWLHTNQDRLGISKILLVALDYVDKAVCKAKKKSDKITIAVYGVSAQEVLHEVTEEEVPLEEALEKFPDFSKNTMIELEV